MTDKSDFLSWDDDSIPWDFILGDDDDFFLEIDDQLQPPTSTTTGRSTTCMANKENLPTSPSSPKVKVKEDVLSCPECPRIYKTVTGFKRHVANVHGEDSTVVCSTQGKASEAEPTGNLNCKLEIKNLVTVSFLLALDCVIASPFRNGISTFGAEVIEVGQLLKNSSDDARNSVRSLLVKEFVCLFSFGRYLDLGVMAQRERLCWSYGKLFSCKDKMNAIQEAVRASLGLTTATDASVKRFTICLCRQLMQTVVEKLCSAKMEQSSHEAKHLTNNDQSILYYISGFILHGLRSQVRRQASRCTSAINNLLKQSTNNSKTFVEKYREWTKKLDRGGLVLPSDDFFFLIREFEMLVRKTVNPHNLTSNSFNRLHLTETICESFMVNHYWEKLCPDSEGVKDSLLEVVIKKFLTVRGFAAVKNIKRKMKCSAPCQPSLRKGLKLKSANV